MNRPVVSLLVAVARNGVIGRNNDLPWHLPEDLKRFKALTLGYPVVMGRRTYESIIERMGRPLPGRDNIVVTRRAGYAAPGCRVVHSLEAALAAASGAKKIFVIGGADIFALALPLANRLDVTEIDADVEGDVVFPAYDRAEWREVSREAGAGAADLRYDFVVYERAK
ncbi:MAG TPA: dihydrofolate reductase [Burkholderiales bacterium]